MGNMTLVCCNYYTNDSYPEIQYVPELNPNLSIVIYDYLTLLYYVPDDTFKLADGIHTWKDLSAVPPIEHDPLVKDTLLGVILPWMNKNITSITQRIIPKEVLNEVYTSGEELLTKLESMNNGEAFATVSVIPYILLPRIRQVVLRHYWHLSYKKNKKMERHLLHIYYTTYDQILQKYFKTKFTKNIEH